MEEAELKLPAQERFLAEKRKCIVLKEGGESCPLSSPSSLKVREGRLAAATDKGFGYKEWNEDAVVVVPTKNAFAVIDGMGGRGRRGAGREAAAILAENLARGVGENRKLSEIQKNASEEMKKAGLGPGGACYLLGRVVGERLYTWQAGDVRAVVVRGKRVVFQTQDEVFPGAPYIVTNAVRGKEEGRTTRNLFEGLRAGDKIVVASDGIWDNYPAEEIVGIIEGKDPVEAVKAIGKYTRAKMTKGGGKPDNRGIVVYKIEKISSPTIAGAADFFELLVALDYLPEGPAGVRGLQGPGRFYPSSELKQIVSKINKGKLPLKYVTRTAGLREKVERLLGEPRN